ncbi:Microsomal glutathione S-transferase 1 [Oryzias melastigma]|uniref:Microsomal glutathione S-transferase 1 n=1 Tax=Oryzias melastigma TaxID=30732 RepID=A0A834FFC0_ORYME|nr:Microsomal glutathione S-transferase 1 [Oryzias melastigma]
MLLFAWEPTQCLKVMARCSVSEKEVECLQALAPPPVFSRKCYCETQSELLSCRDARRSAKMAELLKDQVFMAFTTHAAIVTLKLLLMGPLTGYFRITRKVLH